MNSIRNENIGGTVGLAKVREIRLRQFRHVESKESGHTGQRILIMELPGKRKRGKSQRRRM